MTEITQWLLRRTLLAFFQRELVTKIDQEFAIAVSLPSWKYHDAGQVVVHFCLLLFTEVAHHVIAVGLAFTKHIEVEGINLIPNVLVIEEKLGDIAQVFRVNLLLLRVKLKHADLVISVYLITWRAPYVASLRVIL